MAIVQVNFSDGTMAMVEEISAAIERAEGYRPSRAQLVRMAISNLRKRMVADGSLKAERAEAEP